jgi:metal-responsive CopG/Arc/MetJ family transcriptional regulator
MKLKELLENTKTKNIRYAIASSRMPEELLHDFDKALKTIKRERSAIIRQMIIEFIEEVKKNSK